LKVGAKRIASQADFRAIEEVLNQMNQRVAILAFVTVGLYLANFLHWLWLRGDFSRFPSNRYLRIAFFALGVAAVFAFLAERAHWIRIEALEWLILTWTSAQQAYSIWVRQTEPPKPPETQPPGIDPSTISTWAPFQSAEVREICRHLAPEEKRALLTEVLRSSRTLFFRPPMLFHLLPLCTAAAYIYYSYSGALIVVGAAAMYVIAVWWWRVLCHQRRMRELLCATNYASDKGYRVDSLKLFSFPWSR
jgi:hypothetical protein